MPRRVPYGLRNACPKEALARLLRTATLTMRAHPPPTWPHKLGFEAGFYSLQMGFAGYHTLCNPIESYDKQNRGGQALFESFRGGWYVLGGPARLIQGGAPHTSLSGRRI